MKKTKWLARVLVSFFGTLLLMSFSACSDSSDSGGDDSGVINTRPVASVVAASQSANAIKLTWTNPEATDANFNGVSIACDATPYSGSYVVSGKAKEASSAVLTGLKPNTEYSFTLYAQFSKNGKNAISTPVEIKAKTNSATSVFSGQEITPIATWANSGLSLTWTANEQNDGVLVIIDETEKFEKSVQYSLANSEDWKSFINDNGDIALVSYVSGNKNSVELSGLSNGKTYKAAIVPVGKNLGYQDADKIIANAVEGIPMNTNAPQPVSADNISVSFQGTSAKLSWEPSASEEEMNISYLVSVSKDEGTNRSVVTQKSIGIRAASVDSDSLETEEIVIEVPNLSEDIAYTFKIAAKNKDSNAVSESVTKIASRSANNADIEDFSAVNLVLGKGYDIFGSYIQPAGIKASNDILDFQKLFDTCGFVKRATNTTNYQTKTGSSLETYQAHLSATIERTAGIEKLFSKSLKLTLNLDRDTTNDHSYASVHTNVSKVIYNVKGVSNVGLKRRLSKCVTTAFSDEIEELNEGITDAKCKALFEAFGTHVILGATLGGRYDFYMVTNHVKEGKTRKLTIAVNNKYTETTKDKNNKETTKETTKDTGASASDDSTSDIKEERIYAEVVGGDNSGTKDLKSPEGYSSWIESTGDEGKWALIAFDESMFSKGILPVWKIVAVIEGGKFKKVADALEKYYPKYAEEKNAEWKNAYEPWKDTSGTRAVWDAKVVTPGNYDGTEFNVTVNTNGEKANVYYHTIHQDFNEGCGWSMHKLVVAYCTVREDGIYVQDKNGKEVKTTYLPVNQICVENVMDKIGAGGWEYTDMLHGGYVSDGRGCAGWRLCMKRGKDNPVQNIWITNSTRSRTTYPAGSTARTFGQVYGAEESDVSVEKTKGKLGQNICRYAGKDLDNIYISYGKAH